jgi:hypothetical protein
LLEAYLEKVRLGGYVTEKVMERHKGREETY